MSKILDGKAYADRICRGLKERCDYLKSKNINPRLNIITTGEDSASKVYVRNKIKRCEEIGIEYQIKHYDFFALSDLYKALEFMYTPTIIQEPIAGAVTHNDVSKYINSKYDVDGFGVYNMAQLYMGYDGVYKPCTPAGIMALLIEYNIPLEGKNALVIGRSNIVGRPMASMLECAGCTVTVAHSFTPEIKLYSAIKSADIIVSAVGKKDIFTYNRGNIVSGYSIDWRDKIIIDVGMNRDENGKLCGDVSEELKQLCAYYTPVPGGVGPMTVAMLMSNVIDYYQFIRDF